jgi:hypothetical protein
VLQLHVNRLDVTPNRFLHLVAVLEQFRRGGGFLQPVFVVSVNQAAQLLVVIG